VGLGWAEVVFMLSLFAGGAGECHSPPRDLGDDQEVHDRSCPHLGEAVSPKTTNFIGVESSVLEKHSN